MPGVRGQWSVVSSCGRHGDPRTRRGSLRWFGGERELAGRVRGYGEIQEP